MRTLLLSALALGALTTATAAEPMKLTDGQMDRVTAGLDNLILQIAVVNQTSVPITTNTVTAVGVGADGVTAIGSTEVTSTNTAIITQQVQLDSSHDTAGPGVRSGQPTAVDRGPQRGPKGLHGGASRGGGPR